MLNPKVKQMLDQNIKQTGDASNQQFSVKTRLEFILKGNEVFFVVPSFGGGSVPVEIYPDGTPVNSPLQAMKAYLEAHPTQREGIYTVIGIHGESLWITVHVFICERNDWDIKELSVDWIAD